MRLTNLFEARKKQRKKILSPYLTAGYPNKEWTVELMHRMVKAGADIIELGIPFSDPMAEGPVIQRAMEQALEHGTSLFDVLGMVQTFREQDNETPVILMGYLNPIEVIGYEHFASRAQQAGVDGTIIVDLPPEEATKLATVWEQNNLAHIFLCSPTTTEQRIQGIAKLAHGYVYYVSLKGVTGANTLDVESVKQDYLQVQKKFQLPLLVGFGIKTPQNAAQVAEFADGVIIGAALINTIETHKDNLDSAANAIDHFISSVRQAMDCVDESINVE